MFLDNYVTEYKPPWKSDISSAEQIYLEPFLMHELEDILRGGGAFKTSSNSCTYCGTKIKRNVG